MISEDFVWLWVLLHSTGHSNVAGIPIKYGIQQHAWKGEISRWTRGNDTRNDALFSKGCKRSYLQDKQDDNMAMVQRRQTYDSVYPVFVVSVLFSTVAAERPQVREAAPSECPSEQRLRPVEHLTFLDQSTASSLQPPCSQSLLV